MYVLLLYWKDDNDDGFNAEADALDDLFVTHFNYPRANVERFEIPLEGNLQLTLERRIMGHESLLIIHYGGHGDADAEDKQFVWAKYVFPSGVNDLLPLKLGFQRTSN